MTERSLHWSRRTTFERQPNRLALAVAEARAAGRTLLDLTESNPTRVGLQAPASLLAELGDGRAARYAPTARGAGAAREAVAAYYHRRDLPAEPERIVLTASTSEAYGWLLRTLADPGDEVLVPQPSYPLLPLLARLEGVELRGYPLLRDEGWRVDVGAVERALCSRTRAIVLVHPNNPTGSLVHRDDAAALGRLAREAGVALIVDEVFGDFLLEPLHPDRQASFAGSSDALCFVLSGLSKLALLPQLKLGWIACYGPAPAVGEALARLDWIADSYLSVSTPVQLALPTILQQSAELRRPLLERLQLNLVALDTAIAEVGAQCPIRRLPVEAGWYVMVEVPRTRSDDDWVERLATQEGLIVHPGYFFDLEKAGTMVLSLLLEPDVFAEAIERAVRCWSAA